VTGCPQCGAENGDDVKNCGRCRVNMYWAFQHHEELAAIRRTAQLAPSPDTPVFLLDTSERVDAGSTAGWLRATIVRFGFRGAGKKVSTMAE
jgi:hypothetical protein